MASVAFENIGAGCFRVDGRLSFDTVAQALEASKPLFAEYRNIELDLSGVAATDSAGLALLIEWLGRARRGKCALKYRNVPEQTMAIARISDVDQLLPIIQ